MVVGEEATARGRVPVEEDGGVLDAGNSKAGLLGNDDKTGAELEGVVQRGPPDGRTLLILEAGAETGGTGPGHGGGRDMVGLVRDQVSDRDDRRVSGYDGARRRLPEGERDSTAGRQHALPFRR